MTDRGRLVETTLNLDELEKRYVNGARYYLCIVAEIEVEQHPDCPVCGQVGCEIVHRTTNEEPQ